MKEKKIISEVLTAVFIYFVMALVMVAILNAFFSEDTKRGDAARIQYSEVGR